MIEAREAQRHAREFQPNWVASSMALEFLVGDMLALPFPSGSFQIVTTGYGLRNVPNLATAIEEIGRVLSPGGQLLSLDFNRPSNRFVRSAYLAYLTVVGAALGWVLHRDPDTYRYIPASIRQYPGAEAVARLFESRGFTGVRCYPVLGGLMTIHHAIPSLIPLCLVGRRHLHAVSDRSAARGDRRGFGSRRGRAGPPRSDADYNVHQQRAVRRL